MPNIKNKEARAHERTRHNISNEKCALLNKVRGYHRMKLHNSTFDTQFNHRSNCGKSSDWKDDSN